MPYKDAYSGYEDYNQNYGNPYDSPPPVPPEPDVVPLIAVSSDPRRTDDFEIQIDENPQEIYRPRKQTGFDRVALLAYAPDPRRVSIHPSGLTGCPAGVTDFDWLQLDADHLFPRPIPVSVVDTAEEVVSSEPATQVAASSGGGRGGRWVSEAKPDEPEAPHDPSEMPFLDHLEEFRWALLKSIFAVAVAMIGSWFLAGLFYATITRLAKNAELPLIFTKLMEPIMIQLQMAFVMGLVIALPFVFYFLWSFISPGLYANEKKWILPLVIGATGCFLVGASIAYFMIIPLLLGVIKDFMPADIEPMITIGDFISKLLQFTLLFGVLFEMPLVSFFLAKIGILKYTWMRQYRRYAIVLVFVVSAIFTPPDPISQVMMAVPLVFLYEVSVWVAKFAGRKTILNI